MAIRNVLETNPRKTFFLIVEVKGVHFISFLIVCLFFMSDDGEEINPAIADAIRRMDNGATELLYVHFNESV